MYTRSSRPAATLFGIPLHIHWSALLTAGFIAFSAPATVGVTGSNTGGVLLIGALAALFFGVSLLAHEYAHALVARRRGIGVRRVSLWALGGMAELETEPRRWQDELAVSIVGPLTSIAVGVMSLGAALALDLGGVAVPARLFLWLAVINIGLGIFNLLPGYPLDGGRVLHALAWWRNGNRNRATVVTANAGRVIGMLLVAGGVWMFFNGAGGLLTALIGWFVLSSATQAKAVAIEAGRLAGRRAGDAARPLPPAVRGELSVDDFLTYWAPANPASTEEVVLIDADQRATGVVPMAAVWSMPPQHRPHVTLDALAIPAAAMAVVTPDTDLGDASAMSASGFIMVAEPERLVGLITPRDLHPTPSNEGAPAGQGVGA